MSPAWMQPLISNITIGSRNELRETTKKACLLSMEENQVLK